MNDGCQRESRTQSATGKISKTRWVNPESRQKIFATATYESANNDISLWSVPTVSPEGEIFQLECRLNVDDDVNDMEMCGGASSHLAAALNNGDVVVINTDNGDLAIRQTFSSVHDGSAANAISAGDNTVISGGSDGSIVIFDLNKPSQRSEITSQMSSVRGLAMMTPNLVVSSHLCGRIYVWDVRERFAGQSQLKPAFTYYPTNTPAAIMTVAAHPADRHMIGFGTEEGVVGFLDTRVTSECAAPIALPFSIGCINEIAFHPNYPDNVYCVSSEGLLLHLDATKKDISQRMGDRNRSKVWQTQPSAFSNANVSVLLEEPLPVNSVDICADGVIAGGDSHMITLIDSGFFV